MTSSPRQSARAGSSQGLSTLGAVAILALATLAMFGDVLFQAAPAILSDGTTDTATQYLHWRTFGFGELGRGNLALWNPHIYSGTPYFGGFQSALLYPPNWIYLILPVPLAINWSIALHVFSLGCFMFAWARHRTLSVVSSLLTGLLMMFCGAHFLHVFAGHLSNLCTMIWAPLVFLAIDGIYRDRRIGWVLLGACAVALQILAGHPQYVFFTALSAAIYASLRLVRDRDRVRTAAALLAVYAGGAALAAVQVLPGIEAAGESVRSEGLPFELASMFSFPPGNFLTFFVPFFFGDGWEGTGDITYWGRCYLWEISVFFGITGLFLAVCGASRFERSRRHFSVTMVVILFVLALGRHTPVYRILYEIIPGLDSFRAPTKFNFQASLFLTLLAGMGFERLRAHSPRLRVALPILGSLAIAAAVAGWWVHDLSRRNQSNSAWQAWMQSIYTEGREAFEIFISVDHYRSVGFIERAGDVASTGLYWATATLVALALLVAATRLSRRFAHGIALLAVIEVFTVSHHVRPTFRPEDLPRPPMDLAQMDNRGDERIHNPLAYNAAMSSGAFDVWGYDPGVSRRYAEFMAATQGYDPSDASQYVPIAAYHERYKMLRCRHALFEVEGSLYQHEATDTLPRVLLIDRYELIRDKARILARLNDPRFDHRSSVILESEPDPRPVSSEDPGTVTIVDSSTDHLTIEANVNTPALLLVTDGYADGWRVEGLEGGQDRYEVLPANYVLRAVPLEAGRHVLRMEYAPRSFRVGRWITIVALLGLSAAGFVRSKSWARLAA